jgi:hypothetical protein
MCYYKLLYEEKKKSQNPEEEGPEILFMNIKMSVNSLTCRFFLLKSEDRNTTSNMPNTIHTAA